MMKNTRPALITFPTAHYLDVLFDALEMSRETGGQTIRIIHPKNPDATFEVMCGMNATSQYAKELENWWKRWNNIVSPIHKAKDLLEGVLTLAHNAEYDQDETSDFVIHLKEIEKFLAESK